MAEMFEAVDERTPFEVLAEKESGVSIEENFRNVRTAALMRWARENGKRFDTIELKCKKTGADARRDCQEAEDQPHNGNKIFGAGESKNRQLRIR